MRPYLFVKRAGDIVLSAAAALILLPFLPVAALVIKLDSPGPVFFTQRRVGKDKRIFKLYKFRTMRTDAPKDTPTHLLSGARAHITPLGAFMRRASIDELPQLVNILRGDMSIVGPRPALWNQDDLVAERGKYGANGVRPGLTGLAQVMGRDELPIPQKAAYDGQYVAELGFLSDCRIVMKTFAGVIAGKGVVDS
ncbi:MAG: sugar transferase [Oscillospiraceae bacterium]|nr:sugar transferase [Oscillospiraceae bacterium]